ncbi:RadC family protein [Fusibacter tunisiensis]|uniref:DNA repair protein RadC n=1 Tax=Fusibacter tunisiensis TaxID=1008308 RepID=A0ABS2MTY9_9FIRM|nr:DNA repair protein RadC [Fusibacter tunisiensis]MBM7562845.1 DNA repair protein RadC [Fusibacter tunisiensis]
MGRNQEVKERLENYGTASLFDREAVAFITGIDISKLEGISSLKEIRDASKQLSITEIQSQKLDVLFDLSNRIVKETRKINKVSSPSDIANYLMEDMRHLKQEEFRIVLLDTKNQIIKVETVFKGTLSSCIVHPREIFKEALLAAASSLICVHNHPSGSILPSNEDINITKRIVDAGSIMGIKVLDSLIIGDNSYTSLKEDGVL